MNMVARQCMSSFLLKFLIWLENCPSGIVAADVGGQSLLAKVCPSDIGHCPFHCWWSSPLAKSVHQTLSTVHSNPLPWSFQPISHRMGTKSWPLAKLLCVFLRVNCNCNCPQQIADSISLSLFSNIFFQVKIHSYILENVHTMRCIERVDIIWRSDFQDCSIFKNSPLHSH